MWVCQQRQYFTYFKFTFVQFFICVCIVWLISTWDEKKINIIISISIHFCCLYNNNDDVHSTLYKKHFFWVKQHSKYRVPKFYFHFFFLQKSNVFQFIFIILTFCHLSHFLLPQRQHSRASTPTMDPIKPRIMCTLHMSQQSPLMCHTNLMDRQVAVMQTVSFEFVHFLCKLALLQTKNYYGNFISFWKDVFLPLSLFWTVLKEKEWWIANNIKFA